MPKYAGRKAVVVGGVTGLGLAIAKRLVEGGAEVLVTGGPGADLDAAADEVGSRAHVVRCDPADPAAVEALAPEVGARLGRVDLLFVHADDGLPAPPAPGLLRLLEEDGSLVLTGPSPDDDPAANSLSPVVCCRGPADETADAALRLAALTPRTPRTPRTPATHR
ncbi:SDR family NAD(P)-dependent oxidoreductase [Streptomyces sp. KL118A]|uniref:SDR family NAD(P)-dependent oxidoreductase n=1 Tax=Streptomyces sp. KL118A TaxID=3045153 RepID=UPI00278C662E|nr:SDR family NAD(P)-dependent oxidoreductase [Streptomyces sp. KL118A]